eukprot:6317061-Alexandrium_andersonii.AAC.1
MDRLGINGSSYFVAYLIFHDPAKGTKERKEAAAVNLGAQAVSKRSEGNNVLKVEDVVLKT